MNKASLQSLLQRTSGKFIPQTHADFVGMETTHRGSGSRAVALHLECIVASAREFHNAPIKVLLNGKPGIGKTGLALYLQHLLKCDKWSTSTYNGTQLKIERIEEINASLQYKSLYNDYRLIRIDEADQIPSVAQCRFLSLLDDLPNGVAVVCTSNCELKNFENRFQTRFQALEVIPPTTEEITHLLTQFVPQEIATKIANFSCGNVRQALIDTLGALQQSVQPSFV